MLYLNIFYFIIKPFSIIVPILIAVAFLTLYERKIMASIQRRRGPISVGIFGLLQPFADALKLLLKENIFPSVSNYFLFALAPILSLFLSLITWTIIPFDFTKVYSDIPLSLLYIFAISSLNVYSIILAGWSSNSKYAFLGALRSAAQMISYEVSISIIVLPIIIITGSLNLSDIVNAQKNIWFIIPFFPLFFMFFISSLAETNRPPFDLPEAEAELVSGYNVEYSSIGFALFFIAEYSNIFLMSALIVILFLGGWLFPLINYDYYYGFYLSLEGHYFFFSLKLIFISFLFIWVRATLPRYRFDQLMTLGWKIFLPLSLSFFFFYTILFFFINFFI